MMVTYGILPHPVVLEKALIASLINHVGTWSKLVLMHKLCNHSKSLNNYYTIESETITDEQSFQMHF